MFFLVSKKILKTHLLAAATSLCLLTLGSKASAVEVGTVLPQIRLPAIKGEPFTTERTKGKVTLINFWATWCEACKVELLEFEKQLKPLKNERDFQVVFINLDKDPRQAIGWAQKNLSNPIGFLERNYLDGGFEIADQLKVDAFPFSLVIGRDSQIVYKQKGFNPGEGLTEKMFLHVRSTLSSRNVPKNM